MKKISYIIPAYNESENIPELIHRVVGAAESQQTDYEIIIVDDGSTDGTSQTVLIERKSNEKIHVIELSRNFGSHSAILAGLSSCTGDAAVVLAADLQDPPAVVKSMIAKWESGCGVVWACRKSREGETLLTRLTSKAFYWIMNRFSSVRQSALGADFFLIDRKAIKNLVKIPVRNSSILMTAAWIGYNQGHIFYEKKPRKRGVSKWTLKKKINLFINSFFSFSDFPVYLIACISLLMMAVSLLIMVVLSVSLGFVLLLFGIQGLFIFILGLYLQRNFDALSSKPDYLIKSTSLGSDF